MSVIFEEYEKDYIGIISEFEKNLKTLNASEDADASKDIMFDIDRLTQDATSRLKDMDLEVRMFDSNTKKGYLAKLMEFRQNFNNLQNQYNRAKEQKQRSKLIGKDSQANRERLLTLNEKLAGQQDMIYRAHAAVLEAEGTGTEILGELGKNREVLEGIKSKTTEFIGEVETADKQVNSMQRRANREKNCVIS